MITNSYNDSRKDLNKPPVSIQYEEILAGELFNMYDDEYYVVFFDFKDSSAAIYASILEKYEADSDIKVYKVDLSKGFNEPYISEESNPNVKKIGDLKINGPTLIKIKNKKNGLYVRKDSIEEVLK